MTSVGFCFIGRIEGAVPALNFEGSRGTRSCHLDRCAGFPTSAKLIVGASGWGTGIDSQQEQAAPSRLLDLGSTVHAASISSPRGSLVPS